jgi:hypothetical protein
MNNNLIVSTHQPSFLPWFGLMYKIKRSDVFVLLDDVQFNARSFQHRAFYSANNKKCFLTLYIEKNNLSEKKLKINQITLKKETQNEIYQKLFNRYHLCPGWKNLQYVFEETFLKPKYKLIDIIYPIFNECLKLFNIKTKIYKSSEFNFTKRKSQLMLEITKHFNGKTYISGNGGRNYLDEDEFKSNDVKIQYLSFKHPNYKQTNCKTFLEGCFALEWYLENPNDCINFFKD